MRTGRRALSGALVAATVLVASARPPLHAGQAGAAAEAQRILQATGVKGGLIVHLGCGDGRLTAALRASDSYVVHGLDSDPANVAKARERIQARGLYGPVSVDRLGGTRLPYAENLATLVVADALGGVPVAEVMRALCPGGVAYVAGKKTVKPVPKDTDEWSHYLHDASGNAVAADLRVGPPRHMRWLAGPRTCRSHEFNSSINAVVTAAGRIFYIHDEGQIGILDLRFPSRWVLVARDAFSGVLLWKRPIPHWGYREWNTIGLWGAPLTLSRRVVTDGPRVFATFGYKAPLSVIDAATGKTLRTIDGTLGTDEIVCSDGVVLACVRQQLSVAAPPKTEPKRRVNPHEWSIGKPGAAAIVALDAESGRELWRRRPTPVAPLTLGAAGGRVCFHDDLKLMCLDLKTGKQRWATPCRRGGGPRHTGGTLVLHEDVVLYAAGDGVAAFSATDGKQLWKGPRSMGSGIANPPDLFVAAGLVWLGRTQGGYNRPQTSVKREGRDPRTGEVKRTVEVSHLVSPQHHWRCYRSKATDRYLLLTKRGIEFLDLKGGNHMRNDWLRPPCSHGCVPANGLLYVPPHQCFCYPGVKLWGFNALAAQAEPAQGSVGERLERGPAFGTMPDARSQMPDDWPMYRRDPQRGGCAAKAVPTEVAQMWQTKLGGRVTPPVVADGKLLVAKTDAHQICCLDAKDGKMLWSFIAGGRVDSAPTIDKGRVLFGCCDGWVYCLRATDGALAWRSLAAPDERRMVSHDQIESVWPVHGSVIALDDVVYCSAGRSTFLDGGIHLSALDAATGKLRHHAVAEGPWPDVTKDKGEPFDMEGSRNDILVTDGTHLYLYQLVFDLSLRPVEAPRLDNLGSRKVGRHLMATGGFLNDSGFDRNFWVHSGRWPGYYFTNAGPKAGQILVFDDKAVYGLHIFIRRARLSPTFTPGKDGCKLFADDIDNEPVLTERSVNREKGPGYSRAKPPRWEKRIPVRAQAMVLAGEPLFLAGPPDVVPADDPYASFDGKLGATLWAVKAADGTKLAESTLDALPVFDGLIAAGGRLYLCDRAGRVTCLGARP